MGIDCALLDGLNSLFATFRNPININVCVFVCNMIHMCFLQRSEHYCREALMIHDDHFLSLKEAQRKI